MYRQGKEYDSYEICTFLCGLVFFFFNLSWSITIWRIIFFHDKYKISVKTVCMVWVQIKTKTGNKPMKYLVNIYLFILHWIKTR